MKILLGLGGLLGAAFAALLIAGRMGLLAGSAPGDLGVRDGRLKPPSATRNSVSSQADMYPDAPQKDYALVRPLRCRTDPVAALARVKAVIESMPGARLIEEKPDYLYATFTTPWLRFVDDVEFWASPTEGVIHVRSASRIGREDFGANRKRVDEIRAEFKTRR